ncbi:sesquipedalian-1 isoform X1 [Etheostoma spectabile]|nr:sesquipedalian-1-like isoform X1 [Etheostoma spectabile]
MLQVQVKAACDVEMKINEKVFTYFESCTSQVDKEGYLYKKGEIKTSYQKRWCVLKGNLLFYKDRPADRDVTGVIVLEGCTVQLCESEELFAFSLLWAEPGLRTYKFAAEDQASQESWIKALLSASHSYLALLVSDMEKKYRDALGQLSSEPANPFIIPKINTVEAGYNPAVYQKTQSSPLPLYQAAGVGAGPGLSSSQTLQPLTHSPKSASKRSPKLWSKRNANVVPVNTPALPLEEWSGVYLGPKEEFTKLHEDFGKEVKELIADWLKKGQGDEVVQGENLIDFG